MEYVLPMDPETKFIWPLDHSSLRLQGTDVNKLKPKLCIITPAHWSASAGGAELQVKYLVEALAESRDYDIYFLARRVAADFLPQDYKVIRIRHHDRVPRLGFLVDTIPIYRALQRIRPNIIYQRVACGYTGIAAYYARRYDSRLIWHIAHDDDVTLKKHPGLSNPIRRFLEKRAIEYGIHSAHHIVAQTTHQAVLLNRNYCRQVDAVVKNFHPEPEEEIDKSGPLTVLWIANLKSWKQPDAFVRLARELRGMPHIRFVMIGAPPNGRRTYAQHDTMLREIDAAPNLEYIGNRSQQEVNAWLARSHLFVNTSVSEGFPNTFIQAWMRCVPVLSLYVDPDGVLRSEGVGIQAGSEARLAEAVRLLLTDSARRHAYAIRAREYALRAHSFRNIEILRELIDTGQTGSAASSIGKPVTSYTRPQPIGGDS